MNKREKKKFKKIMASQLQSSSYAVFIEGLCCKRKNKTKNEDRHIQNLLVKGTKIWLSCNPLLDSIGMVSSAALQVKNALLPVQ